MKIHHLQPRFLLLIGLTLVAFAQRAEAQGFVSTLPDSATFENTTVGGSIVDNNGVGFGGTSTSSPTQSSGPWSIVAGSGNLPTQVLQNVSGGGNSFANLRFGPLGTGTETGFTESTDFLYSGLTTPGTTSYTDVGLSAASSNSILYQSGVLAQFVIGSTATGNASETTGNLILSNDFASGQYSSGNAVLAYNASGLTPTVGDKYTLTLTGIYNYSGSAPALGLYASITDDTTGVSSGILSTTLAGVNAAYNVSGLIDTTSGGGSATVDFDNYSMALATTAPLGVPEPSSWVLLGLGLFAVIVRLRRTESKS